jgi:hypothetical protein
MMERTEKEKCVQQLEDGKVWKCIAYDPKPVKTFVSIAYGGIDFDGNFELHQIKTPFGQMISVRKK